MNASKTPHIYFTVTNDLTYDQRMHRICGSLAQAGYKVTLVGRELKHSLALDQESYQQKRLGCFFNKGFLFYAEYNLRLFFFLLTQKMDVICAIDLDTILPALFVSKLKSITRIYDAHEYFTELKEVRTRPAVKKAWTAIEKFAVPKFEFGYTVSEGLRVQFKTKHQRNYLLIRNFPLLQTLQHIPANGKYLLYQGAVNEARGFEYLIPAMKYINCRLIICGDGNFMPKLKKLIIEYGVQNKVELTGMLLPQQLKEYAAKATLGLCLSEDEGLNQYYALSNKFLENIHAGLPQVAMNFPEYKKINDEYKVAVLIDSMNPNLLVRTINTTIADSSLLNELHKNALLAREDLCWQKEEIKLLNFYNQIFI